MRVMAMVWLVALSICGWRLWVCNDEILELEQQLKWEKVKNSMDHDRMMSAILGQEQLLHEVRKLREIIKEAGLEDKLPPPRRQEVGFKKDMAGVYARYMMRK